MENVNYFHALKSTIWVIQISKDKHHVKLISFLLLRKLEINDKGEEFLVLIDCLTAMG